MMDLGIVFGTITGSGTTFLMNLDLGEVTEVVDSERQQRELIINMLRMKKFNIKVNNKKL